MNFKQELDHCLQSDFTELFTECKRQGASSFAEFLTVWKRFGMVRIHNYYTPIPRVSRLEFLCTVCDVIVNSFFTNANIPLFMIKVYSVYSVYIISCCGTDKGTKCKVRINFRNWPVLTKVRNFFLAVSRSDYMEQTHWETPHRQVDIDKLKCCAKDFLGIYDIMWRSGCFVFSVSVLNSGRLTDELAKFSPAFPRDEFDAFIDSVLLNAESKEPEKAETLPKAQRSKKRGHCISSDEYFAFIPTKKIRGGADGGGVIAEDDGGGDEFAFWQDGLHKDVIGDFTEPWALNTERIGRFLNSYCTAKSLFIEKHAEEVGDVRTLNIVNRAFWDTLRADKTKYLEFRGEISDDVVKLGHTKSGFITSKIIEGASRFVSQNTPASAIPVTVEVKNGTQERPKIRPQKKHKKVVHISASAPTKERWSRDTSTTDAALHSDIPEKTTNNSNLFENTGEDYVSAIISGDGCIIQGNGKQHSEHENKAKEREKTDDNAHKDEQEGSEEEEEENYFNLDGYMNNDYDENYDLGDG